MRPACLMIACLSACLAVGCDSPGPRPAPGELAQRVLSNADPDDVLNAAAIILKREFGRARVDPAARSIETAAVEFTARRDTGTAREFVGGSATLRRKAVLFVGQRGQAVVVRLRVDVERRDTERQTAFQPRGYRISDLPGQESPIDRDTATSAEQTAVWTPLRRDSQLERAILTELQERFAGVERAVEPVEGEPREPEPEPEPR